MADGRLVGAVEAILFSLGRTVSIGALAEALGVTEDEAEDSVLELMIEAKKPSRGVEVVRIGNGYRMRTKAEYYEAIVRTFGRIENKEELDGQTSVVLAAVAYRQPVTKAEVDAAIGADSREALSKLLDENLIEEKGRLPKRGSPISYGTTEEFLERYGLSSEDDLPTIDEMKIEELAEEAEAEAVALFGKRFE